jgi:hypothetical protein
MKVSTEKRVRYRSAATLVALGTAVAALSACASNDSSPASVIESVQESDSVSTQAVSAPDWGHVHNLSLSGDVLFIGSHEGMWQQAPQQEPVLRSAPTFDVMGLTRSGDRWLASGHPGPDMDAPSNLGLVESRDSGVTWKSVSLSGEVDFHRLVAAGEVIMGVAAADNSLLRSTDGGTTWNNLGTSPIFDLAMNPMDTSMIMATTESGPVQSTDGGATFTPVSSPSQLLLLAWSEEGLYASSVDGQILFSADSGVNWVSRGTLGGQPMALAVDASNVVGVVGDSIFGSSDGGVTFTERIVG